MTAPSPYGERALDVEVAEALGWRWCSCSGLRLLVPLDGPLALVWPLATFEEPLAETWHFLLPRYSSDPAAYMGLLEEMRWRRAHWTVQAIGTAGLHEALFFATVWLSAGKRFDAGAVTLGEAICRAVLAALGSEARG